jgi:hypothetical protein
VIAPRNVIAGIVLVVCCSVFGQAAGCALTGCNTLQNAIKDPDTRALIDKCVDEGRDAARDGAKPEEAAKVFDDCIARGLPKDAATP